MATTIEGALVARLVADSIVNGLVANRIHPFNDPRQIARPKLTYWRVNTTRSSDDGGLTNDGPTGMAVTRIQFDAWADSMLVAKQVVAAVRHSLNGFAGTLSGLVVNQIHVVDERDNTVPVDAGQQTPVQRVSIDCMVTYTDA